MTHPSLRPGLVVCFVALLFQFPAQFVVAQDSPEDAEQPVQIEFSGEAALLAWGNLEGIRLQGELFPFMTSIQVVTDHWDNLRESGMHRPDQAPDFQRSGNARQVSATLDPIRFVETVTSIEPGTADIAVEVTAVRDTTLDGVYFHLELLASDYPEGSFGFIGTNREGDENILIEGNPADVGSDFVRASATGLRFGSIDRGIEINFETPTEVIVSQDTTDFGQPVLHAYMTLLRGELGVGQAASNTFRIQVTGVVDVEPVAVSLDASRPGRVFDGIGGNFQFRNANLDSIAVSYNLENLDVAWGRVEMPLPSWQPDEDTQPLILAESGRLNSDVDRAMRMARTLAQRKVPVIVSAWQAPDWALAVASPAELAADTVMVTDSLTTSALEDAPARRNGERQTNDSDSTFEAVVPAPTVRRSHRLNPEKVDRLVQSIGDYLVYLKQHYGVEAEFFSLNEPDLGVGVLQTAKAHSDFIVAVGKHLATRGLSTKLLLGDTSNPHATDFIRVAMADPLARPYIGGISFHSWSGWSDGTLEFWRDAAQLLNVPLIVAAGATDPSARHYPQIFQEALYAMDEIKQYTELLSIAQPKSILQWQLTADYPVLASSGITGDETQPLAPTQRFWNLKQLSATPAKSFWLPVTCNNAAVTCAAFGDIANGVYAVHIVNDGAGRMMKLTGLPSKLSDVRLFVTDGSRAMEAVETGSPDDGTLEVELPPVSFTTIIVR